MQVNKKIPSPNRQKSSPSKFIYYVPIEKKRWNCMNILYNFMDLLDINELGDWCVDISQWQDMGWILSYKVPKMSCQVFGLIFVENITVNMLKAWNILNMYFLPLSYKLLYLHHIGCEFWRQSHRLTHITNDCQKELWKW